MSTGVAAQWSSEILAASAAYGVPPAVIAAIMEIESSGRQDAQSPMNRDKNGNPIGRAQGLMQVMPFHFGVTLLPTGEATPSDQSSMRDPTRNVNKGASLLASEFANHGTWSKAAGYYFGIGTDVGGQTTSGYIQAFRSAAAKYSNGPIPGLAGGGWVGMNGPQLALLGERGPEYVVSNRDLRNGGGGHSTMTLNLAIGGRVAEQIVVEGYQIAVRRGRLTGAVS